MKVNGRCYLLVSMVIVLGLVFTSCGGESAAKSDISGVWKSNQDGEIIKIDFASENKTIEFGGQTHKAVIEKEDDKMIVVKIDEGEKQGTVRFSKMWSDNGSDFTLVIFLPDGTRKDLVAQN